ncbi:hypothetical protein PTE30175_03553 [Pandoraea terrae]|uniref:Uncharacterized protein n=2 Tax=Pandoraea terrae TaxID=1537710 RepID=A0A5E4X450_9BURK|nr:hypothetical protein PTE30175_03553 [Pandoraea terrae]
MLETVSYKVAAERGERSLDALAGSIRRYYTLAKEAAAKSNLAIESYCEVSEIKKEYCYKTVEEARSH